MPDAFEETFQKVRPIAEELIRESIFGQTARKYKEKADELCISAKKKKDSSICRKAMSYIRSASDVNPEYRKQLEACQQCYAEQFSPNFVECHLASAGVPS